MMRSENAKGYLSKKEVSPLPGSKGRHRVRHNLYAQDKVRFNGRPPVFRRDLASGHSMGRLTTRASALPEIISSATTAGDQIPVFRPDQVPVHPPQGRYAGK